MKKNIKKKPIITALEQRILFDGAAAATAVDVLDNSNFPATDSSKTTNNDATSKSAENSVHEAQAVQSLEQTRKEIAFVDTTVKDYQTLVDGVGQGVEVYLVSSLDEINSILKTETNIDAIHILSHGSTGEITVGNDVLSSSTLDSNAQLLESMKNSLTENGDILLYGCNVASDGRGQEFINTLANLTQADVAASDDATGSATLGGDWVLEKNSGNIDVKNIIVDNYENILSVALSTNPTLTFISTDQTNIGQIIHDGNNSSSEISDIELNIFNANKNDPTTAVGSFVYFNDLSVVENGNQDSIVPIDVTSGSMTVTNPPDIIVIKSDDGSEFNFKSIEIMDYIGSENPIKFEGFKNGVSTGSVTLAINQTTFREIFNQSNGLTASIFENVDEVRITNQNGGDMVYGNYAGINRIQIGEPVIHGPTVSAATGSYTDTAVNDIFTNKTGTISATASSGSITGYGISGGTNGSTTINSITYDVSKAGTYGTLYVKSSDGSYVYVPTSDSVINATTSTVTDIFTIQATDGGGTTGNTLTITINGVNDTPVLTAPTSATYTDTSATDTFSNTTGTLSASDRDTGATLSYGISSGTTGGSTSIGGVIYDVSKAGTYGTLYVVSTGADKGKYVYVPTSSAINALTSSTTDTFTVSSSDGNLSNTQTLTVNITGVNDTPTAVNKTITINEDTPTVLTVSDFGFSDVDTGSALVSVKITSLVTHGTLEYDNGSWTSVTTNQVITAADITSGKLRFNPTLNENGTTYATFNFTVNDGTTDSTAKTITYNVTAVNDAPTVANAIVDQSASVSNAFSFQIPSNSFADVDTGDTLTYTAQLVNSGGTLVSGGTLPSWLTFTAGTRTFGGTPALSDAGTIYIKVTATDNGSGSLSTSDIFSITVNSGPTVSAATGSYIDTAANDIFTNKTGTISATASSGSITGYGISGGTNGSTTINSITYDVSKAGTYGTLYVKSSDGSYVYVPTSDSVINAKTSTVTDVFTIQATDGGGTTGNTLTITINGVNDTPVLTAPSSATYTDTSANDTFANTTGTLSASDRDSGTTLSYGISSGTNGSTTINSITYDVSKTGTYGILYVKSSDGSYVYVPNASAINALTSNTTDTFTVSASDGSLSNSQTLTINLTAVNDTPVLTAPSSATYTDTSANDTFTNTTGTLSASDRDSGTTLSYGISSGTNGSTTINSITYDVSKTGTYGILYVKSSDGSYVYVPNASAINALTSNTTDTFTVSASDGSLSNSQTLTINLTAVNDTPVLTAPSSATYTDTSANDTFTNTTGTLSASDRDSGTTLSYGISSGTNGSTTINSITYDVSKTGTYGILYVKSSDGSYVYVPNASAINALTSNTTDTFTVSASDGSLSNSQTLTINLTAVNDTPVLTAPSSATYTDTSANDTFANTTGTLSASDRDSGTTLSYGISSGTNGSTTINSITYDVSKAGSYGTLYVKSSDGSYVYVPNASAINALTSNATDTFTVSSSDGSLSNTQTFTVNVTAANDTPVGTVTISGTPTQGETLTVTNNITDAEGMGTVSYQWYADGVLINGATNSTYILTQNEVNKNITVVASYTDGLGANETVTSSPTINVVNVNDAPTVSSNNIDVELGFGDSYTKDVSVLFNDIDFDNVFTYEAVNLPLGLSINPITGVISGSANSSGEFIITIKVIDNGTPSLSISRTYKMMVVAPAQVEVPQPSPIEKPTSNTPMVTVPPIVVTTFADTLSLGTINNNLGNEVADNVGTGYLNNNGLNPQETTNSRNNNSDNQAQTTSPNRNNGNYIEADANLNVNANGQVIFDRATQDSFSTVGIAIENMTIENNRLEIKVVDTSVAQNFVVTKTDGTALPTGLSFDPRTGSISGTVPENLDKLDITIKATNPDGTTRVLNIKIDLKKLKEANRADGEKYIGLKDQLAVESQKLEGYGNYLVSLFA